MDVYPSYMNGIKVSLTRIFAPESHAFPQTCLGGFEAIHPATQMIMSLPTLSSRAIYMS
ncbi:hypothetical protein L210DRAFT_954562, partial [Boletus edulis BED1]